MKKIHFSIFLCALLTAIICLSSSLAIYAQSKSIEVTVYNQNIALVKDQRSIDFKQGLNSIDIEDVSANINASSVLLKSLSDPNSIKILEQNYKYDLISPENILNKSVGQKITVGDEKGILLNPPKNGGIVVKTESGKLLLDPSGQKTLDTMPEGLYPKPTLNWLINSEKTGRQDIQLTYLTGGLNWVADYVALVNEDDTKLDLAGWVTITNNSGTTYKDAKLTLLAGDVRIKKQTDYRDFLLYEAGRGEAAATPQFEEKSFFEYHIYKMARTTTIADAESKQISLLNASNVPVKKEMTYDPRGSWFRSWWYPGRSSFDPGSGADTSNYHKINVTMVVKNSEENNMGMPLPKGTIRVYKLDDDKSQQFIGEDIIDHTPKNEEIRLYIGDAFDVVGDYKRTDYKKIAENVIEESFEAEIRNHKKTAVEVRIAEHVWSDWKVVSKTHDFVKIDARTIHFPVKVPAEGKTTVKYTIRTKW
ncbi:MAG: DUF4139 domain-containing protein [Armatimonadota bacterium]